MHRETPLDFWLTLATVAALFVPIWGVLLEPSELIRVPAYLLVVGMPAFLLVIGVLIYAKLRNKVLLNRFLIGYAAGFVGAFLVHMLLLAGGAMNLMPDLVGILGRMMLGVPFDQPVTGSIIAAGLVYHYLLNGAAWGAVYSLVFGKTLWWVGVIFGPGIAAILMVTPVFLRFGFQRVEPGMGAIVPVAIILAHIAYGSVLGIVVHKYVFPEVGVEGAKAIKPTYA